LNAASSGRGSALTGCAAAGAIPGMLGGDASTAAPTAMPAPPRSERRVTAVVGTVRDVRSGSVGIVGWLAIEIFSLAGSALRPVFFRVLERSRTPLGLGERGAEALYRVLGSNRIRQPGAAGGRNSQSTFHCRGAERSLHLGCAWESFGVLGSAAASLFSIARWNGPGIEAAMPDRMGSPKNVAAIVIITTDTRTMSTSLRMRLENCFVIVEPSRPIDGRAQIQLSSYANEYVNGDRRT
jgi:hypothetical protein